jgi:pimeloyl-ACP methyl ester carboxylesterase
MQTQPTDDAPAPAPSSTRIAGADGLSLHLLEWSREGVPLLFLHGFGNEAHIWDDFAPVVAPYYRTLALDHRGHGDSSWDPNLRYEHDAMVDDLEFVTAALGIERLVLIGHSLGGRIATLFAGRHPERLAGFVLVDIGPEVDPRGQMRIRQDVEANVTPTFGSIEEYARVLSLAYPAGQAEALLRMARFGLRARDDGRFELKMDPALRGALGGSGDDASSRQQEMETAQWDALARIPCPTLVVRGAASDILSPEVADRMVDDVLQNGRLAIVPQAGHSVMTDNPQGFREAVSAFVLSD